MTVTMKQNPILSWSAPLLSDHRTTLKLVSLAVITLSVAMLISGLYVAFGKEEMRGIPTLVTAHIAVMMGGFLLKIGILCTMIANQESPASMPNACKISFKAQHVGDQR